jgi:hypothetical protein
VTADASAALDKHLSEAIAEFSPTPGPGQAKDKTMSRGLLRLKGLTEKLMQSVETAADKAAAELQKDHDEAIGAVESIGQHVGGSFKAATAEVKDMLNQITNGE